MGARKNNKAEMVKEAKKTTYFAKLHNVPTSPRKMRLVADMVRGKDINEAMAILKYSPKEASNRVYKLLLSAIANWEAKNEGERLDDAHLYISEIFVDSARMLKRIQTAPQGRAYRVRKRSNHVTLYLSSRLGEELAVENETEITNE
jgi:large subunit ribosomal protein L22